jgi:hypothetical protein
MWSKFSLALEAHKQLDTANAAPPDLDLTTQLQLTVSVIDSNM